MLRVQPANIILGKYDKLKTIRLTSLCSKPIMYKAKTTNNQVMTANPTIGTIKPNDSEIITVKVFGQKKFKAKIMVSYVSIDVPNQESQPSDIRKSISSSAIQRSIIQISKETDLDLIIEEQPVQSSELACESPLKSGLNGLSHEEYQQRYADATLLNNRLSQQIRISQQSLTQKLRESYQNRIILLFPSQAGLHFSLTKTQLLLGGLVILFAGYLIGRF